MTIRPLTTSDRAVWERLFSAYAEFYETEISRTGYDSIWDWIFGPQIDFWCDVLVADDDHVVGIVQYQLMHNPLRGAISCFLSDVYVAPEARGQGGGTALIDHVLSFARERGIKSVRWLTQEHNSTARRIYDRYAPKTDLVFYSVSTSRPE